MRVVPLLVELVSVWNTTWSALILPTQHGSLQQKDSQVGSGPCQTLNMPVPGCWNFQPLELWEIFVYKQHSFLLFLLQHPEWTKTTRLSLKSTLKVQYESMMYLNKICMWILCKDIQICGLDPTSLHFLRDLVPLAPVSFCQHFLFFSTDSLPSAIIKFYLFRNINTTFNYSP